MILILVGAPGAGKGTQSEILEQKYGFKRISTGDVLRDHIKRGTEIGRDAEAIIAAGKLVSDSILLKLINSEIDHCSSKNILLDGYPRNLAQAKDLENLAKDQEIGAVVHLEVPRQELVERLSGRRVCSGCGRAWHLKFRVPKSTGVCDVCGSALKQRPDDLPDRVSVRLNVYAEETEPMLEFYSDQGLYHKIDGMGERDEVLGRVLTILDRAGFELSSKADKSDLMAPTGLGI